MSDKIRLTARWYDDVFPPEIVEAQEIYEQLQLCRRLRKLKLTEAQWNELRPRLRMLHDKIAAHRHGQQCFFDGIAPITEYLFLKEDARHIANRILWHDAITNNEAAMAASYAEAGEKIKQINAQLRAQREEWLAAHREVLRQRKMRRLPKLAKLHKLRKTRK